MAKRMLQKTFHAFGMNTGEYRCKMLLIEPGSLDNKHGKPHTHWHLKQAELVDVTRSALTLNQKFMHIIVRGGHAPNPDLVL